MTLPFENLEAYAGTVYRYALRLTGRTDAAEDLAQEALLRAWRRRNTIRDERAARVWLLRVTQNLWTDLLRRKKFRPQALEREPNCPRLSPSRQLDEREAVAMALAAMDELPARQRQVLYLSTCEELTHAEVAEVLDLPVSAVKASLSLARKEMRRRLKDVYEQTCGRKATD